AGFLGRSIRPERSLERRERAAAARAGRRSQVQAGGREGTERRTAARRAGHRAPAAGGRAPAPGSPPAGPAPEEPLPGERHSAVAPRPPSARLLRREPRVRSGYRRCLRFPRRGRRGGSHRDVGTARVETGWAGWLACAASLGKTTRIRVPRPPGGPVRSSPALWRPAISGAIDRPQPPPSPPVAATR